MAKIKLLDKHVAELIAAGEVVERPSSVIKELMENSIDSGATVITVEIRNGGITFMRITDNGCGISAEDVPTAFLRHATSKVLHKDDLNSIATLGFRGEALASISAVSHVELLTKTPDSTLGTRYAGGGNEEFSIDEAGCPTGTTIIIRDLFFNTPARMKFLKKDSTEGNAVSGIVDKIALSHPEISIRFIRDGKEQLHTPGDSKLSSAIYAVFGREFSNGLIPVDYALNNIKVSGFISVPAASRANRSMQNFFINNRFVRSRTAGVALEEAYKGSIMVGKFPACVLNLQMSFETVDVNVHPAKLEVRFVNERPIFDAVYHAVKSALTAGDKTKVMEIKKPTMPYAPVEKAEQIKLSPRIPTFKSSDDYKPKVSSFSASTAILNDIENNDRQIFDKMEKTKIEKILDYVPKPQNSVNKPTFEEIVSEEINIKENAIEEKVVKENFDTIETKVQINTVTEESNVIGQAFGTYIIVQYGEDNLMLIDKHAAHERILYEKFKVEENGCEAQTLLSPITVTLDKDEYSAVINNKELLLNAGFEVDEFGVGTVLVRTIPMIMDGTDAASTVMEIAGYLAENKSDITTEHMDWVYHNVACRAAIKGGSSATREEIINLALLLEENPQIRYCPHGRPVSVIIKKYDIEKQFGRV